MFPGALEDSLSEWLDQAAVGDVEVWRGRRCLWRPHGGRSKLSYCLGLFEKVFLKSDLLMGIAKLSKHVAKHNGSQTKCAQKWIVHSQHFMNNVLLNSFRQQHGVSGNYGKRGRIRQRHTTATFAHPQENANCARHAWKMKPANADNCGPNRLPTNILVLKYHTFKL